MDLFIAWRKFLDPSRAIVISTFSPDADPFGFACLRSAVPFANETGADAFGVHVLRSFELGLDLNRPSQPRLSDLRLGLAWVWRWLAEGIFRAG